MKIIIHKLKDSKPEFRFLKGDDHWKSSIIIVFRNIMILIFF